MKKSVKFISLLLACGMLMSMASCSKKDKEPDAEQIQKEIDSVAEKLDELKESSEYESLDSDEKAEKVIDTLKQLAKKKYVDADTIHYDEESQAVTYLYGSGVLACELIDGFDEDVNSFPGVTSIINYDEMIYSTNNEQHADAIILDAMTDRDWLVDQFRSMASYWSEYGIDTKIDYSVTLDDLANLKEYEFVLFEMHGKYLDYSGMAKGCNIPVIFLEQKPSSKALKKYSEDFTSRRVGVMSGQSYFVTPSFFEYHYKKGDLSNTIFFMGSCETMGKDTTYPEDWPKALESASMPAFVAFHNVVYTNYTMALADVFMDCLLNGSTVEAAYEYSINLHGDDDVVWRESLPEPPPKKPNPAFPILRGDWNSVFSWDTVSTCPVDESKDPNTNIDFTELYEDYMRNELIPQYGWTSTETSTFCLSVSNGSGFAYNPSDSQIEAAGIISADVDDYNGDGVDDLIVIYMYKESANGVDSVYTDSSWFSSPQTEIYRTKLAAFTVSGNNVVKTDEYDVVTYGIDKQNDSLVGCLFPQEQDQKRMTIFKVYKDNTPSILFSNVLNSGPMFRYFCETSWFMGINQNGKFYMKSCYIGGGITNGRYSYLYEFSNGVETSYEEYHNDADNPGFESPYVTDYYDDHQVSYYEDDYYWSISENNEQVFLAGYDVDITDSDSSNGSYYYSVTFFDGGNLSSELR